MDCHSLLQGFFPTQGLNLSLQWQADSLLPEPTREALHKVDQPFSTGRALAPPHWDIWRCLKILLGVTTREGILLVWVGGAVKHSTVPRNHYPPQQRIIWPKMSIGPRLRAWGRLWKGCVLFPPWLEVGAPANLLL